jgi:hypothetical protein
MMRHRVVSGGKNFVLKSGLVGLTRHVTRSFAYQAGARLVSQPPTPRAEPLPVMCGNLRLDYLVPEAEGRSLALNELQAFGMNLFVAP